MLQQLPPELLQYLYGYFDFASLLALREVSIRVAFLTDPGDMCETVQSKQGAQTEALECMKISEV